MTRYSKTGLSICLGACALHASAAALAMAMALMAQPDSDQCATSFEQNQKLIAQQQRAAPSASMTGAAKRLPQSLATAQAARL